MTAAQIVTAIARVWVLGCLGSVAWVAWQILAANAADAQRREVDERADRDFTMHAARALTIVTDEIPPAALSRLQDAVDDELLARRVARGRARLARQQ